MPIVLYLNCIKGVNMAVVWNRHKWLWIAAGLLSVGAITEAALLFSGNRVFIQQILVHPRQTYIVHGFGDVGKQGQASLVCRYFTGRGIATDVLWYSSTNQSGRDECPFFSRQNDKDDITRADGGSTADWVSGIGSLLAVIVALLGYFLVEKKHRNDDLDKLQGHIYQIGYKLSTLASEAGVTLRDLRGRRILPNDLMDDDHPFLIVNSQYPVLGYEKTMVRDLSDAEQNLLMMIREEEFLMDFSECVARNDAIRSAFVEYGIRREELLAELPAPDSINGHVGSFETTAARINELMPRLIPAATLVVQSRELAARNVEMLAALCGKFKPMMDRHYPSMHVHSVEILEPSEQPKSASN
jgi:hypothetical protein